MRFVLIGTGNIAGTYVNAVNNLSDSEIVGLVTRSQETGTAFAQTHDLPNLVIADSISAMPVPYDAVIIALPNGLHHGAAVEAASLGKHVFTEKVLDISIPNMDAIINACREHNVKLSVAFQRRFSPDNMAVKSLLTDNAFGKVYAADLAVKFYRPQSYYDSASYRGNKAIDGGGPFMQQASHNIDIYTHFFGLPTKVVSMLDTFCHDMEGEDHGAALLRYENGLIGTIITSTAAKPGFLARLEIHTEKGSVILENDQITHWSIEGIDNPTTKVENLHSGASAAVTDTSGHEAALTDFIEAIEQDREPAVSGASAKLTTELILSIYNNQLR